MCAIAWYISSLAGYVPPAGRIACYLPSYVTLYVLKKQVGQGRGRYYFHTPPVLVGGIRINLDVSAGEKYFSFEVSFCTISSPSNFTTPNAIIGNKCQPDRLYILYVCIYRGFFIETWHLFFFWPGKGRVCCGDNFTLGICQSACQSLLTRSLQVAAKIDQTVIAGDRPTG